MAHNNSTTLSPLKFSDRSFDDALATSTSDGDYQRKMAKAMRMRSERNEQAIAKLREEQRLEIQRLQKEFAETSRSQMTKFHHEMERKNAEQTSILENALSSQQRQFDIDKRKAIEEVRNQMEEECNSKIVSILTQHQDSNQGLVDHHKEELRKRLSQMAQQKDELHHGDKILALKENDKKWEMKCNGMIEQMKQDLSLEHETELNSVKKECEKTVQDLTVQYTIERNRLGAEMLDQREETRALTSKAEQSKLELKLKDMKLTMEADHRAHIQSLKQDFEKKLLSEEKKWNEAKINAVNEKEEEYKKKCSALESEISSLKLQHEQENTTQLAISGRITEQLELERDQLLKQGQENNNNGLIPTAKTLVASMSIALLGVMAVYAMFMIFEYRHWLFYAHSLDRRFT